MTLPTTINFPSIVDNYEPNFDGIRKFMDDFVVSLNDMYDQVATNVNGNLLGNSLSPDSQWIPTLDGTAASGTFTYTKQDGWALRQGIITDVWFDIAWTAVGTAAGNLFVNLPYQVALSTNTPFVGVIQSSTFAYSGGTGVVINGIPGTYRGEIWNVGSGFVTANQAVVAAGELIGHIRYMGVQNEP